MTNQPAEQFAPSLTIAGLAIALLLPQLPFGTWLNADKGGISAQIAIEAIFWGLGLAAVLWVLLVERRPLSSIGIRAPTLGTFGWAAVATVALMASVMLSYALILPMLGLKMNESAIRSITGLPLALQAAVFLRAGVVEEILFRGYPIERVLELTRSKWAAGLAPGAVFIAGHYTFWGLEQLIILAFGTVILTLLYLWRRDLICCMVAHAATDIIGFALASLQR